MVDNADRVLYDHTAGIICDVCLAKASAITMDNVSHYKMLADHGMCASKFCVPHNCKDDIQFMLYRFVLDIGFR